MEDKFYPSSIATAVVFFNEEGFAMEKTIKSLQRQHKIEKEGHDLLLVGDGMKHMTSSMGTFLQSIFPQAPIHLKDWPDWANICIVNRISGVNWTQGRISLVLKKTNLRKWNSHEWHLRSFAKKITLLFSYRCGLSVQLNFNVQIHCLPGWPYEMRCSYWSQDWADSVSASQSFGWVTRRYNIWRHTSCHSSQYVWPRDEYGYGFG